MVVKQGETYEEEQVEDNEEESPKASNDTIKKVVFIIVAVVILAAIAVVIVLFLGGSSEKEEQIEETEQYDYIEEDYAPLEDTDFETNEFDSLVPVDESDSLVSFDELNGDVPDYTSNGFYSADELKQLRAHGYTADEIEFYAIANTSYEALIETAEEDMMKVQNKLARQVNGKDIRTFKDLYLYTPLINPKVIVPKVKEYTGVIETVVENVDYVKCAPTGKQLFIRCRLADGVYVFMPIMPERWNRMNESGNIVITYGKYTYGKKVFIGDLREVDQGGDYVEKSNE